MRAICYADDTLLVARGQDWASARRLATCGATLLVKCIEELGLRVALEKTETIWFHRPRRRPPAWKSVLAVNDVPAKIGTTKYLELVLDSRWSFGPHFERVVPRALTAAHSLSRLLPNLGGPKDGA